ncbi:hypothetical protein L484_023624 [Morus notabilis]|uniref:Uncharacterized protein n=1 Tax=Morus notabilis TaxID=981085 RepID=W9S5K7_9ROSA|nr:hypothetical protein L484_023624 [Morus notabilis]
MIVPSKRHDFPYRSSSRLTVRFSDQAQGDKRKVHPSKATREVPRVTLNSPKCRMSVRVQTGSNPISHHGSQ